MITDIALAPRNANGKVEYETDIMILRPLDRAKGNRRVWYELTNRGAVASFSQFNDAAERANNPTKAHDAGNGFLMRQGYTILISGWDISAPSAGDSFTTKVPVAVNADGSPIVGPSMEEFVVDTNNVTVGRLTYPAATLDKSKASLTVRVRVDDPPEAIPAEEWDYANEAGTAIKLAGDKPFRSGTLYEFVYSAKNPLVAGLGFAAIRDLASFIRNADKDDSGTANPLAGNVQNIYTACVSQPCRTMHDFVWLGFNEDESGRKAIDGIVNWIGGATGIFMNYRFAQPFRTHRQHIGRNFPEFQGPFTNEVTRDGVTGKSDGRLRRCLASNTCPKIFEANSENEYWAKNMALLHVDTDGKDLAETPDVRSYLVASLPHSGGQGATGKGMCQQERNPLVGNGVLRALLVAMDEWVTTRQGAAGQPIATPGGRNACDLAAERRRLSSIPGVTYNGRMHTGDLFDYGPRFRQRHPDDAAAAQGRHALSGAGAEDRRRRQRHCRHSHSRGRRSARDLHWLGPPRQCRRRGLRSLRPDDPFLRRRRPSETASGDPRPSLEERYASHADYLGKVTAAANALKADRLLLDEDVQAIDREGGYKHGRKVKAVPTSVRLRPASLPMRRCSAIGTPSRT